MHRAARSNLRPAGVVAVLVAVLLGASQPAQAQPAARPWAPPGDPAPAGPERTSFMTVPERKLAVYAELTSAIFTSSLGASISYRPWRGLAFSAGAGGGYIFAVTGGAQGFAGQFMVHALFGRGTSNSFEVAGGLSGFVDVDDDERFLLPAFFIGYRRQSIWRRQSPLLWRVGFAESYGLGFGLDGSVGVTF